MAESLPRLDFCEAITFRGTDGYDCTIDQCPGVFACQLLGIEPSVGGECETEIDAILADPSSSAEEIEAALYRQEMMEI